MSRNIIRGATAAAIAASVERSVEAGRFGGDACLPTVRTLAATLHVSPVTVAAAYRLLQSRGLVVADGRRGTRLRTPAKTPPARLAASRGRTGLVDLATGNPDPALLPPFGDAIRALSPDHHLYGGPQELPALAAFAAGEFAADGVPGGPVAVTSGGLDAIERVLREHLRVGDRVAVEDPTLPALLDLLASLGLTPEPVFLDDEGPRPDSFERALGPRVRAVVMASRAHNPTGAALSSRRAVDLARLLHRRPDTFLVEVDDAAVVSGVSLVTLAAGREHWAMVKSTSKFLGPDLRVAVLTGDPVTVARVRRRQAVGMRWVSRLLQGLALALWSDPSNGRRLARAAELYATRRRALLDALAEQGIGAHGRSGFNVWIPVREETATVQGLADRGWAVTAGERFRLQSPPAIRVTVSTLTPEDARRLAADLAAVQPGSGSAPA